MWRLRSLSLSRVRGVTLTLIVLFVLRRGGGGGWDEIPADQDAQGKAAELSGLGYVAKLLA